MLSSFLGWPAAADHWGDGRPVLILGAALLVAMVVDHFFGEPAARWHPVVWIGHALGWAGRRIAPRAGDGAAVPRDLRGFSAGAVCWCVGAAVVGSMAWAMQSLLLRLPAVPALLLLGCCLKPLLAWRMLREEVLAVESALGVSLGAGRAHLARLVSRDVAHLGATAVRESAIESLAENLNDSVVAPIFWFLLLGLPGAAVYRFANTADAMWGYRGERGGRVWEWAGKWAARADDVLSWWPARITAVLLVLVTWRVDLRALRTEAARTPSPNSGWPMAAMALALRVVLRKPGIYVLNAGGREAAPGDTRRAVNMAHRAVVACVLLSLFAMMLTTLEGT